MPKVTFLPDEITVDAADGTTLIQAQIDAGLHPDAPCGGNGSCGKCLVDIIMGDGDLRQVLACQTMVYRDMTVKVRESGAHNILSRGAEYTGEFKPLVRSARIMVKKATLTDLSDDWSRVTAAAVEVFGIDKDIIIPDPDLASVAGQILRDTDFNPCVIMLGNRMLDLRADDARTYMAAVDIGTTTVVLYLMECTTGKVVAISSRLNPQTEYGGDVISRANYAINNGVRPLSSCIRNALNELLSDAAEKAGIKVSEVYAVSIVGNTCMHHLFLGVSPESLVHSPYNPAISVPLDLAAGRYGINAGHNARLVVLPCIAGFVGADTAAVILASDFDKRSELTLAIDIGTNGELVLGDKNRLVTCSTAAGPAFEGAKITFGMRGAEGAIDHFKLDDNRDISYSVIGGAEPVGICGSGLMDLVALLLDNGVIDESGRFVDDREPDALSGRIEKIDKMKVFVIAYDGGGNPAVYLSQKDIREVQLAKGAMAAGIQLLLKQLGKEVSDVGCVLIAGAFGNYMDPQSACRIGLIPPELSDRITGVGNAAGEGAKQILQNADRRDLAAALAAKAEFVELATDPDFQDIFVDKLEFPE